MEKDIRWLKQFSNLKQAFQKLKETAEEIVDNIISSYYSLFEKLVVRLDEEANGMKQTNLF